jgi:hypothetical protein
MWDIFRSIGDRNMALTDKLKNAGAAATVGIAALVPSQADGATVTQTITEDTNSFKVVETYTNDDNATYDSLEARAAETLGPALYSISENQDDYSSAQDLFNTGISKAYDPSGDINSSEGWKFDANPFTLSHYDTRFEDWTDGKHANVIYTIPKSLLDDVDSDSVASTDWSANDPNDWKPVLGDSMSDAATAYSGGAFTNAPGNSYEVNSVPAPGSGAAALGLMGLLGATYGLRRNRGEQSYE